MKGQVVSDEDRQEYIRTRKATRGRRWPRRVAAVLAFVVVVFAGASVQYVSDYYRADQVTIEAAIASASVEADASVATNAGNVADDTGTSLGTVSATTGASFDGSADSGIISAAAGVSVTYEDSYIAVGSPESTYGLVLYPGARVEASAYIPLAVELAERGCYCVIAKMPFNLAFFGIDAADALMATAPDVESWWVGGHSLGGVAAATYAAGHAADLDGLVLLASYSITDLSDSGLAVESIYGSEDGVLNFESLEANADNLPADTVTYVIEGGNHAGFGAYGAQTGDSEATISAEQQWEETADELVRAMREAA